jgi:hypothetical protein
MLVFSSPQHVGGRATRQVTRIWLKPKWLRVRRVRTAPKASQIDTPNFCVHVLTGTLAIIFISADKSSGHLARSAAAAAKRVLGAAIEVAPAHRPLKTYGELQIGHSKFVSSVSSIVALFARWLGCTFALASSPPSPWRASARLLSLRPWA